MPNTFQIWKKLQAKFIEPMNTQIRGTFTSKYTQIIYCYSLQFPWTWKSWMELWARCLKTDLFSDGDSFFSSACCFGSRHRYNIGAAALCVCVCVCVCLCVCAFVCICVCKFHSLFWTIFSQVRKCLGQIKLKSNLPEILVLLGVSLFRRFSFEDIPKFVAVMQNALAKQKL